MALFEIKNRVIHRGLDFDEYQKLPGISHSDIRMEGREPFKPTAKMNLGTDVHNYLLTPAEYSHGNITIVRPIAIAIKSVLKGLWEYLLPEVAVNATFCLEGFEMLYRGRVDLCIPEKVIFDLKIIHGSSVKDTIERFHYDTQVSGYGLGVGAKIGFLIAYSTKTKQVEIVPMAIKEDWWALQIITRGKPC